MFFWQIYTIAERIALLRKQSLQQKSEGLEKDEQTGGQVAHGHEDSRQRTRNHQTLREQEGLSIAPSQQGIGSIHNPSINAYSDSDSDSKS